MNTSGPPLSPLVIDFQVKTVCIPECSWEHFRENSYTYKLDWIDRGIWLLASSLTNVFCHSSFMIAGSRIPNTTTWSRAANIVQVHRPSILLPWRPIRQLWVISRLTILFTGFKYRVHRRLYTGAFLCLPNHIPALCPSMYDLAYLNHSRPYLAEGIWSCGPGALSPPVWSDFSLQTTTSI